ncbi:glycosyltransferase family 2 protein [Phormidesmis priestleyi ULC007]|uniref:Glycosyltransferase family 2 protein n=2 Tax=Phormidesmis priestleyi TaxID=268141 RepID=A0A2T1DG71_9CYAN|nr:glycosyltransferase family 2 protein [Phormidesmis priestleyi ULC007]PZO53061.1 MAG: glycosyltransferase family 2 protein [Phormidesmis priestleyi]
MSIVSVCIPTFNRKELLAIAIDSVLQQTHQDFELIICDDGSIDGTSDMMARLHDRRIHYIRHPQNIGKSNNMISGFKAATGKYFIKFDDDDRLTPSFLEKTSQLLDKNPQIDFVGTDHWVIDSNNVRNESLTQLNSQKWGRSDLLQGMVENLIEVTFVKQSFQIGATLFRRKVLDEVGYMRSNIQNCEDNDLLVRLALAGKQAYYLPERLMEYRVHAEQQGLDRAIPYLKDKLNYLESFHFESEKIEKVRRDRLLETKLLLGLRLIQIGDTQAGRNLINQGKLASPNKARVGLALSRLPMSLRQKAFTLLKQIKAS